jgi:hypothetical protein
VCDLEYISYGHEYDVLVGVGRLKKCFYFHFRAYSASVRDIKPSAVDFDSFDVGIGFGDIDQRILSKAHATDQNQADDGDYSCEVFHFLCLESVLIK